MLQNKISKVSVDDIEKKTIPDKHYEYVIRVVWNDTTVNVIQRRYSEFYTLQSRLLEQFPVQAGIYDPKQRTIPFLPGKIFFGRSQVRRVALERLQEINRYCKELILLPEEISQCRYVLQFFRPTEEDLKPTVKASSGWETVDTISEPWQLEQYFAIADYEKEGREQTSLTAGELVYVIDKNETGWWFVNTGASQGWVPSAFLEKVDGEDDRSLPEHMSPGLKYICTDDYTAQDSDEITIKRGGYVDVLEKNLDGWWLVRHQGQEGRAPRTILSPIDTLRAKRLMRRTTRHSHHGTDVQPDTQKDHQTAGKLGPATKAKELRARSRQIAENNADSNRPSMFLNNPAIRPPQTPVKNASPRHNTEHMTHIATPTESYSVTTKGVGNTPKREKPIPPFRPTKPLSSTANGGNQIVESSNKSQPFSNVNTPVSASANKAPPRPVNHANKIDQKKGFGEISHQATEETDLAAEILAAQVGSNDSLSSTGSEDDNQDAIYKVPPRRKILTRTTNTLTRADFKGEKEEDKFDYVAHTAYVNDMCDGIDLKFGERLQLLNKSEDGWWFVRTREKLEGWAPASFIKYQPETAKKQTAITGLGPQPASIAKKLGDKQTRYDKTGRMSPQQNVKQQLQTGLKKKSQGPKIQPVKSDTSNKIQPSKSSHMNTTVSQEDYENADVIASLSGLREQLKSSPKSSQNSGSLEHSVNHVCHQNSVHKPSVTSTQQPNRNLGHSVHAIDEVVTEDYENAAVIESLSRVGEGRQIDKNKNVVTASAPVKPTLPQRSKPVLPQKPTENQNETTVKTQVSSNDNRVNEVRQMFERL